MGSGRREKVLEEFMGAVPDLPTRGKGKRLSIGRMDLMLVNNHPSVSSKGKPKNDFFPFVHFAEYLRLMLFLEGNVDDSGFIVGFPHIIGCQDGSISSIYKLQVDPLEAMKAYPNAGLPVSPLVSSY
jgi:hypothetical protein